MTFSPLRRQSTSTGSIIVINTTVLVSSAKFLREKPDLAHRFAAAHAELTAWIRANPAAAQERIRAELLAETTRPISAALVARCWPRLRFEDAIPVADFESFVRSAQRAGFLKDACDLGRLVEVAR